MDAKLVQQVAATIEDHEGMMPCMYLDTRGMVTCGVGHGLRSADAAAELEWWLGSVRATPEEVRAEYQAVCGLHTGMLPQYYTMKAKLRMTMTAADALLDADLAATTGELQALLPEFAGWPDAAQAALLDMAFDLGTQGLMEKFPRLMDAARAGEWDEAAAEANRDGIREFRNRATRNLFLAAASPRGLVSAAG